MHNGAHRTRTSRAGDTDGVPRAVPIARLADNWESLRRTRPAEMILDTSLLRAILAQEPIASATSMPSAELSEEPLFFKGDDFGKTHIVSALT